MKTIKEIEKEHRGTIETVEEYGFEDGSYELSDELNGSFITDDMLILQGWYEALKWVLRGKE